MKKIRGRGVAPGRARGRALVSRGHYMFAHGVDPATGLVTDVRSDVAGENMKGRVFVFPFGKGSTTGSSWFLETVRRGNAPAAIINVETEPIIAAAVAMARLLYGAAIPLVDRLEEDIAGLVSGESVIEVDGGAGEVVIL